MLKYSLSDMTTCRVLHGDFYEPGAERKSCVKQMPSRSWGISGVAVLSVSSTH
jgi:hypothetical protein